MSSKYVGSFTGSSEPAAPLEQTLHALDGLQRQIADLRVGLERERTMKQHPRAAADVVGGFALFTQ